MIEKKMLAGWIEEGSRRFSEAEQLWADFLTLPAEARELVRESLS
ncbi:hypothetical protein BXY51_003253 [Actinoplanes cyaneus]|nr:hypothetical protein [Actinoplanes cyaneus]